MNKIYNFADEEIQLWELCYYIYQGFGRHAVEDFVARMRPQPSNISWQWCVPCAAFEPFDENDCLICGSELEATEPHAIMNL